MEASRVGGDPLFGPGGHGGQGLRARRCGGGVIEVVAGQRPARRSDDRGAGVVTAGPRGRKHHRNGAPGLLTAESGQEPLHHAPVDGAQDRVCEAAFPKGQLSATTAVLDP